MNLQSKLFSIGSLKKKSANDISSNIGSFIYYCENGYSLPIENVTDYSSVTKTIFIDFLTSIDRYSNTEKIQHIRQWMSRQLETNTIKPLPLVTKLSDDITIQTSLVNKYSPVTRHLHKFDSSKFDTIHERCLGMISENYNTLTSSQYVVNDESILFIEDIKENPSWDNNSEKLINFVLYDTVTTIATVEEPKYIENHDETYILIDIVNNTPHIKLCYNKTNNGIPVNCMVGSLKVLNVPNVLENIEKNKFDLQHTLISIVNSNNYLITEATECDIETSNVKLILSNAYPITNKTAITKHIGCFLSDTLIKGDTRNEMLKEWFWDNLYKLIENPQYPLVEELVSFRDTI